MEDATKPKISNHNPNLQVEIILRVYPLMIV